MDPIANMLAVITLLLADDVPAAAQYVNGLPERDAYALAATACQQIAGYMQEIAAEESVSVDVVWRDVCLRAAGRAA